MSDVQVGIKTIKTIKSRKRRNLTIGMMDTDGHLTHDKKSIVEVFAKFTSNYTAHASKPQTVVSTLGNAK